jgi:hypothetical protein
MAELFREFLKQPGCLPSQSRFGPPRQQHFEGAPPPQLQQISHVDGHGYVVYRQFVNPRVVYAKLEEALALLFCDHQLNMFYAPLDIVGKQFFVIAMQLEMELDKLRSSNTLFEPYVSNPIKIGQTPHSWTGSGDSKGTSKQQPIPVGRSATYEIGSFYGWLDHRVVFAKLQQALVPFLEDVLLNTVCPPLGILRLEFHILASYFLRIDNGRRGDGLTSLLKYHIIPFPGGLVPMSIELPKLRNVLDILELSPYQLYLYYFRYYPSAMSSSREFEHWKAPTLEEARIGVAASIGVTLEKWTTRGLRIALPSK